MSTYLIWGEELRFVEVRERGGKVWELFLVLGSQISAWFLGLICNGAKENCNFEWKE
jgi:hypothetical protein